VKVGAVPVITLLTDFGTADYFVAAVKGVILTINPELSIVDITHHVPPQDIESGAFTLLSCYRDFPPETIHVAVVDPGVGSERRGIVVKAGSYYFVGPDNGIFSYVYDREPSYQVFHLTGEEYFRQEASASFHGRDVFAPVAAALSKGTKPEELGPQIKDEVRLAPLAPVRQEDGRLRGRVIHIDYFGNCITNFTRADIPEVAKPKLFVNGRVVEKFRRFFGDEDGSKDEQKDDLFAIWGSAGFLEISANGRSAAALLKAKRGDAVILSS
jgi:S-adenosyl-L-methionine hydrolase (adenosine-forming)